MKTLPLPRFVDSEPEFHEVVTLGETTESLVLEFKTDLDAWRPGDRRPSRDSQRELARDFAAFANVHGGCILFGVKEEPRGAQRVASAIHNLDDLEGRRRWIEQAIHNFLVPSTVSCRIVPIALRAGNILALNIPASRDLVVVYDTQDHTAQFCRRTNEGKDWMNPDEALRLALDPTRTRKLAFLRAKGLVNNETSVEVVGGVSNLTFSKAARTRPLTLLG